MTTSPGTAIGIDVGGTKISGALVDDAGRITRREQVATPADDTAAIIAATAELVGTLESAAAGPVAGVGMACAAFVDARAGHVWFAPNLPWRDLDLATAIGKRQQHAVGAAVVQRLACRAARLLAQEQLEVGIVLAQPREDARQQEGRDRRDDAHPHLARQRPPGGARHVGEFLRLALMAGLRSREVAEQAEPTTKTTADKADEAPKAAEAESEAAAEDAKSDAAENTPSTQEG